MPEMKFEEYAALRERIQATRYSEPGSESTAELIEWFDARTSDGTPIRLGLEVIDYNRDRTTVIGVDSVDFHTGLPWFRTANGGMFDGSRLQAVR